MSPPGARSRRTPALAAPSVRPSRETNSNDAGTDVTHRLGGNRAILLLGSTPRMDAMGWGETPPKPGVHLGGGLSGNAERHHQRTLRAVLVRHISMLLTRAGCRRRRRRRGLGNPQGGPTPACCLNPFVELGLKPRRAPLGPPRRSTPAQRTLHGRGFVVSRAIFVLFVTPTKKERVARTRARWSGVWAGKKKMSTHGFAPWTSRV